MSIQTCQCQCCKRNSHGWDTTDFIRLKMPSSNLPGVSTFTFEQLHREYLNVLKDLDYLTEVNHTLMKDIEERDCKISDMLKDFKSMVGALEFYADYKNLAAIVTGQRLSVTSNYDKDSGEKAREALKNYREKYGSKK